MPYWIQAKVKDGAFSVVVETAKDALASWLNWPSWNIPRWPPWTYRAL